MPEDQRRRGSKQCPRQDIAGIVGPDRHSRHAQRHRHDERQDPGLAVSQQQRDRDGERRCRVVTREGRVGRRGDEQVDVARMGDVRPRPLPYVSDDLGCAERQQRAETRCNDPMTAIDRAPLAPGEEHSGQQGDEEHVSLQSEEPQRILQPVVVSGEAVEELVTLEIDTDSLGDAAASFARRGAGLLARLAGGPHDDLVHAHVRRARDRVHDLGRDVLGLQHLADLLA
jgi:hypothetical protein